jgi:hypothetical protein
MQRVDRIERRRFVGNEFLLYLWFESEVRDGTLSTAEHGPFGLWLEKRLILTAGRESTRITGAFPGLGREAKEALLRGQLPQSAGLRLERADEPASFVLKAEQLAVSGLKVGSVLDDEPDEGPNPLLEAPRRAPKKVAARDEGDVRQEAFFERMHLTQSFESVLEALYRDFLTLRLGPGYKSLVYPGMKRWVRGEVVDHDEYEAARDALLGRDTAARSDRATDIRTLRTSPWSRAEHTPSEVVEHVTEADIEPAPAHRARTRVDDAVHDDDVADPDDDTELDPHLLDGDDDERVA